MFKVDNKNFRATSLASFWRFYCQFETYSTPFSSVAIVEFEQLNVISVTSDCRILEISKIKRNFGAKLV